jgi:hypothetical protein
MTHRSPIRRHAVNDLSSRHEGSPHEGRLEPLSRSSTIANSQVLTWTMACVQLQVPRGNQTRFSGLTIPSINYYEVH